MTLIASGLSGYETVGLAPGTSDTQDVLALQNWLVKNGFLTQAQMNTGPGVYGPATTASVILLQQQLGVDAGSSPGYYGTITIATVQAEIDALTPNLTPNPDQIGMILIEPFEVFTSSAYQDPGIDKKYRVGYGNDLYAVSNGSGGWIYDKPVIPTTTGVTMAAAAAQLQHSIDTDYIIRVENTTTGIGTSTFLSLSPLRQAVLESLAYNYGHVPSTIVNDFNNHSTFQQIANDIQTLTANPVRRSIEANLFRWSPNPAGPITQPEISVSHGATNVADGDTTPSDAEGTDFGTVAQSGSPVQRSFGVLNSGNATLTLGSVSLPSGFSLVEPLSTSLAPGASDFFTVQMDTGNAGTWSGDISFINNDSDENP
jgi:hypothetical protein